MTQPSLEKLLAKVPSKYELVLLASKRARQIKREVDLRPEKAKEYEFNKPLTTALFEIAQGRITAEDLKYVDLFEDVDEGREPRIPAEELSKRFFDADETGEIEISDDDYEMDDMDEPDDLSELAEE
ncbi:MAG: DNA-directed RNA polymerase subunit omega [bacterium]